MKKIIILSIIFCSLFVTGCGCSKKKMKTITCKNSKDNYEVTITFETDTENKIMNFEKKEKITNYDISLKDNYQNFLTYMENYDESIDNYEYDYEINDEYISTNLKIDFSKANHDEILGAPGLYAKYYNYDENFFDLNKAIDAYKSDSDYEGLECN